MKTTKPLLATLALTAGLFAATGANATLVSALSGQAVNDTDLNVTWAANANLAATNTFGLATGVNLGTDIYGYQSIIYSNGSMTWGGAQKWIGAMNTANYLGYHNWRLPTTGPVNRSAMNYYGSYNGSSDYGYNVSAPGTAYAGSRGSEMAHLFYNSLNDKSSCYPKRSTAVFCYSRQIYGWGLANTGPFTNFQSGGYWSGTEYALFPSSAWIFFTSDGLQSTGNKYNNLFALAVRTGQSAAVLAPEPAPVPVPAAAWLLGSGLLGLIGVARRKAA